MKILYQVTCVGAGGAIAGYYATVELDDGATLELSSDKPLCDAAWLALAAAVTQDLEPEPDPTEATIEMEAEDERII